MFDCITIGAATRDVFLRSKEFKTRPNPGSPNDLDFVLPLGSKIGVDELIFETGGGATNTAVTFARQGLKTACICRIGEDPGGSAVLESLQNDNVDTSLVIKDREHYTGYSIILVADNGERTVLVNRGASNYFTSEMIPKDELETKWIFITSLGGNMELLTSLINWTENRDIKQAVIPGKEELKQDPKILAPIFAKADVVIMNREEAAKVTGVPFEEKEKIAHEMCLLTRGISVITDAAAGATACDRKYFYHIGTHLNKAVERTGAGDAFASGFVAGLIKSDNIEQALELAADNASNVVNYFGAKKGILHKGEQPFPDKLQIIKTKL